MSLEVVRAELGDCRRCALCGSRTTLVFGSGNPDADVVLVGEAPGAREDADGVPFVGAAGKLLDTMLARIDLSRDDIYIANVLKCRPPANRNPRPEEIETCMPFLFRQLDAIRPCVVGTLGNFATRVVTGRREGITALRGQVFEVRSWTVLPMFHPAAALHNGSLRGDVEADFLRLAERVG